MKRYFLLTLLLGFVLASSLFAQNGYHMIVEQQNGLKQVVASTDIQRVYFQPIPADHADNIWQFALNGVGTDGPAPVMQDDGSAIFIFDQAWRWIGYHMYQDLSAYTDVVVELSIPLAFTMKIIVSYTDGTEDMRFYDKGESTLFLTIDPQKSSKVKEIAVQSLDAGVAYVKRIYLLKKDSGQGGGGGDDPQPTGTFQGAKRIFGDNLLKSATYNDKTFTYLYDNNGFVTQIDRVKSSSSKTYTITYGDNITVNCTDGTRWTATLNSRGFVGAMEYTEDTGGVERVTFTYNENDQLTTVDYGDGDVFSLTYTDGNITRVTNYDKIIDYQYETSTQSKIQNIGNVMEFDNIFGVDLDDFALLYYMGALGKATNHLPLTGTVSGSTITGSWTTDNAGRAVQATFNGNQFTWNWDE